MSKHPAPEEAAPATTVSSKRARFESSLTTIVGVLVGCNSAAETIFVHADLICHHSAFFKAACKEEWTPEGQERHRTIPLPAYEPDIFRMYVRTLYDRLVPLESLSGYLQGEDDDPPQWTPEFTEARAQAFMHLSKLWVLADFLGDGGLADEIIDLLADRAEAWLVIKLPGMKYIVSETAVDSKLQRLIVNYVALRWSDKIDVLYENGIATSFMRQITKRLIAFRDEESIKGPALLWKYRMEHRACERSPSGCKIATKDSPGCKAAE